MTRTTAMNDQQIMKEIKDGSKKESIKTVYSFHVSETSFQACYLDQVWSLVSENLFRHATYLASLDLVPLNISAEQNQLPWEGKGANESDNFYNFDVRVNWELELPAQYTG